MPRPCRCRWVDRLPATSYFKPQGISLRDLKEVPLTVDEFEALRLADLEGLYQEQAAERMKISRQTFGRIIDAAHRKVAEALVEGKALRIEGGEFAMNTMRSFTCAECRHSWQVPHGTGRPGECPECHGQSFHRADAGRGGGFGHCHGQGAGGRGPGGPAGRPCRGARGAGASVPPGQRGAEASPGPAARSDQPAQGQH